MDMVCHVGFAHKPHSMAHPALNNAAFFTKWQNLTFSKVEQKYLIHICRGAETLRLKSIKDIR